MTDGSPRGLPKRTLSGSWDYGTVTLKETNTANATYLTVPTDTSVDDIVIVAAGNGANGGKYATGASQDYDQGSGELITTQLVCQHMGNTSWTSVFLDLLRPVYGKGWTTGISHNCTSSTVVGMIAATFSIEGGFKGISTAARTTYINTASATSSPTLTTPTNLGPYPGGVALAALNATSGRAESVDGGWEFIAWTNRCAFAYYILDTEEIETPPAPTFTATVSAGWAGGVVYLR